MNMFSSLGVQSYAKQFLYDSGLFFAFLFIWQEVGLHMDAQLAETNK